MVGPVFLGDKTEAISNISLYTSSVAAGATPSFCGIGVYSIDPATQNATLITSTLNDTTLFAAADTAYAKALQSSFTKETGQYYWLALLVVSTAAMPNFVGWQAPSGSEVLSVLNIWPALNFTLSGQTSFPGSIVGTSLTNSASSVPLFRMQ